MTRNPVYIVRWVLSDCERYLLWSDSESGPDMYVTMGRPAKILAARSIDELEQTASANDLCVSAETPHVIHIQRVRSILSSLNSARPLSERDANALLEIWNALETLERSLGLSSTLHDVSKKRELDATYEKLFYGSNLPAVTSLGSKYYAVLTDAEIASLTEALSNAIALSEINIAHTHT